MLSSPAVRDHLVNRARPFIYDTGLAPAAAGGALAALRVVEDEPDRVDRVNEVSGVARPRRAGSSSRRARCSPSRCPVRSRPWPRSRRLPATAYASAASGRPSTPDGISRLRLTAHAQLDDDELARAVGVLDGLL